MHSIYGLINDLVEHGWQFASVVICHFSPKGEHINECETVQDEKCRLSLSIQVTESFELLAISTDSVMTAWHIHTLVHVQV